MKKPWRQLVKESLTKTREERYAELSKNQKLGHWIFVAVAFLLILLILASA